MLQVFIGYDPKEKEEWKTAAFSIIRKTNYPISIKAISLKDVIEQNLYWRKMTTLDGRLYDTISEAPCSTEFAIARFLTPHLAKSGWAIFMDSDTLIRDDLYNMLPDWTPKNPKAVYVVKHKHIVTENEKKKDNQLQLMYKRKNWSSVILFNCNHPANKRLTLEMINTVPGRELHAFCWLKDFEIGELDPEWNYLVGVNKPTLFPPSIIHFTLGTPLMKGYEEQEFCEDWRNETNIRKEWEQVYERI